MDVICGYVCFNPAMLIEDTEMPYSICTNQCTAGPKPGQMRRVVS